MKLSTLSSYIDTILENEKAKAEFKKQNVNKDGVEQQDLLSIAHEKYEAFWNELEFETQIEGEDAEREKNLKASTRLQGETFHAFEKLLDQSSSEKQVAILDCPDIMDALYKNNCFIQELRSRYIERLKKNLEELKTEVEKAQGFPMELAVNHAIRCSHQLKSFALNFSNLKQDPKRWERCIKKIVELINKNTIRSFSLQNVPKVLDQDGKGMLEILKAIGKTNSIEKLNLNGSLHYHEMGDPQMGCCNRTKVALLNALRENSSIVELQYDFKTAFSNPKGLTVITEETPSQVPPKHIRQSSICDAALIEGVLEANRKKKLNGDPTLVQQELTTANEMLGKMLKEFEKFQTRPARDLRVKLEKISSSLQQDFTKLSKPGSQKLQSDPKVESEAAVVFSITSNKTNGQQLLANKATNKAKNGL